VDKNTFGVVGLTDQIIHQVDERLLRQMVVDLVVGAVVAVLAVDVDVFANLLTKNVTFQAG
jgi:hypothetical protein